MKGFHFLSLNKNTDSLRYMALGIAILTSLRALEELHVSGGGGVDGSKACGQWA